MITQLRKTGNSWGLNLPPAVLGLLKIDENTPLEITTDGFGLQIRPVTEDKDTIQSAGEEVLKQHFDTFKALADR